MPCQPSDISLPIPGGPSTPNLLPFGTPFSVKTSDIVPPIDGFPEDLLDIFNNLSMLIPPGILKPVLSKNYGKDLGDAVISLLDQFMPFLMVYKLFLPVLNMFLCIIEVLCALPNPFKLRNALRRLFRVCLPELLALYPLFALITALISLLLLLLALIEYVISQILKLVQAFLRNLNALVKSFQEANDTSILAIARKLGSLLCSFQNLFAILSLFAIIFDVIRDILNLTFRIPPCDSSDQSADSCCDTLVCPSIVQSDITRSTGVFKYLNEVGIQTSLTLPPPFGNFNVAVRPESRQFFDPQQTIPQRFINVVDAFDITTTPKPIFFPTDTNYGPQTAPQQAAYTVDLRLFYNPVSWGRTGIARFIRFQNCIVTLAPTTNLEIFDTSFVAEPTGVLELAGGLGFEDDNTTILTGFATDGITPVTAQATLENFIHTPDLNSLSPIFHPTDGYTFDSVEYTFKPNFPVLLGKALVTLGCEPSVALNKNFINSVFAGDSALKTQLLGDVINSRNGQSFPDPAAAQECLSTALTVLRSNLTPDGVAQFQSTADICLQKLKDDTNKALNSLVGIGFDPCQSKFTLTPGVQFTSKPIKVAVILNERNGLNIANGLSADVGSNLASRLKAHISFGDISNFIYDGTNTFTANLSSDKPGQGTISISLDNNIFCTNTIPADTTVPPSHTLQSQNYQFVYTPGSGTGTISVPAVGEGDLSDGTPRRDDSDLANQGRN